MVDKTSLPLTEQEKKILKGLEKAPEYIRKTSIFLACSMAVSICFYFCSTVVCLDRFTAVFISHINLNIFLLVGICMTAMLLKLHRNITARTLNSDDLSLLHLLSCAEKNRSEILRVGWALLVMGVSLFILTWFRADSYLAAIAGIVFAGALEIILLRFSLFPQVLLFQKLIAQGPVNQDDAAFRIHFQRIAQRARSILYLFLLGLLLMNVFLFSYALHIPQAYLSAIPTFESLVERIPERENAALNFRRAISLHRGNPRIDYEELIRKGWKAKSAQFLEDIKRNLPAIQEVEAGVRKPFFRFYQKPSDLKKCPNYISLRHLMDLLGLQGRLEEDAGRPEAALKKYLTGLKAGFLRAGERINLMTSVTAIACQDQALRSLFRFIQRPCSKKQLEEIRDLILRHEKAPGLEAEVLQNELRFDIISYPGEEAFQELERHTSKKFILKLFYLRKRDQARYLPILLRAMREKEWRKLGETVKSSEKRDSSDLETLKFIFGFGNFDSIFQFFYEGDRISALHFIFISTFNRTGLNALLVSCALRAYRLEHGRYPGRLQDLAPGFLQKIPEDPFTGRDFVYRASGDHYLFYSLGPSKKDFGGRKFFYFLNLHNIGGNLQGNILFSSESPPPHAKRP